MSTRNYLNWDNTYYNWDELRMDWDKFYLLVDEIIAYPTQSGWTSLDGHWLFREGKNGRSYYKMEGSEKIYSEKEYTKLTTPLKTVRDTYKHKKWF